MFDATLNFCNVKLFKDNSIQLYSSIPSISKKKEEKDNWKNHWNFVQIMSNEILKGLRNRILRIILVSSLF